MPPGNKPLPEPVLTRSICGTTRPQWVNNIPYCILIGTSWGVSCECLTHWGWVTHICVGKLTISGSDNGLSPGRHQAIIWTNAGILLIGHLGTGLGSNTYLYLQIQIQIQIRRICICICIWSNFKPCICICICIWSAVFGVFDKYVFKYTFFLGHFQNISLWNTNLHEYYW